jgi:hypothetical protein
MGCGAVNDGSEIGMTRMLKGIGCVTAAFALAFALAPVDSARADVVYEYVGANFTHANAPFTTADKVTGTITFATPLAANLNLAAETPVAFSFTAGVETVTSATYNPNFGRLNFSTDAAGNITAWDIQVAFGGGGQINIENFNSIIGPNVGDQAAVGAFFTGPKDPSNASGKNLVAGEFTIAAAVPEPSTWAMMILGFCGLGFMTYRRKASALSAA